MGEAHCTERHPYGAIGTRAHLKRSIAPYALCFAWALFCARLSADNSAVDLSAFICGSKRGRNLTEGAKQWNTAGSATVE